MVRAFLMGMFCALFMLTAAVPPSALAQAPNLQLLSQQTLPNSQGAKIVDVSVGNRIVALSANRADTDVHVWRKLDSELRFGEPARIGDAGDNTLFNNAAITSLPNGAAYSVWTGSGARNGIFGRLIAPDGALAPTETIVGPGRNYRVYVDVVALSDGTTIVVWNEEKRFRYVYRSPATSLRWTSPATIIEEDALNLPQLTVGAGNRIAIAMGTAEGSIYYGLWNGQGFATELVSRGVDGSAYNADPSVALLPNGTPVVSWRRVNRGYYYAVRQTNGAWPDSFLSRTDVVGIAGISADEVGNLTFSWTDVNADIFVAFSTAQNVFDGPRVIATGGVEYFNARVASNNLGQTLSHVTIDRFSGRNLNSDYTLWSATGAGNIRAKPIVDGDAPVSGNKTTVTVNFSEVSGSPTQVRWRWGAAPTDTQSDSNGWVPFANPLTVPIPSSVNSGDCAPETLFTQVRNATTTENTVQADSITIDNQIGSAVTVANPYIASRASVFTKIEGLQTNDLNADGGANDGDPNFTREPLYYLEISGSNDCSGLDRFQVGSSVQNLGLPFGIINNFFANVLAFTGADNSQGPRNVFVRVRDKAGNQIEFTRVLTYDSVKPVVADGAQLTITPDTRATILANLNVANLQVSDAYPSGYWGFWIANSLTPISDPATNANLNWTPVPVPAAQRGTNTATVRNWSLATRIGTPARSIPANSTIYVYIRALDGAGNPSDQVITQQVTLTNVTLPQTWLPQIRRR